MRRTTPDPKCEYCLGTGEVDVMGQVYAGEPHMAPIDTKPCLCTIPDESDDNEDYGGGGMGVRPWEPKAPKNDTDGGVSAPIESPISVEREGVIQK